MNLMMITLQYVPDGGPSAQLFKMLCDELVKRGHRITMIAGVPHYPTGRVPQSYQNKWIQKTEEDSITVFRVRLPSINRSKMFLRLLQFIVFQIGAAWVALRQPCDAVLVTNPALENFLPFFAAVSIKKHPSVFFVADVYPDVGIELGIFRHKPVIAIVRFLEKFCLSQADFVWIFSEAFTKPLEALGVPPQKQVLIHGWVDTNFIKPLPKMNDFSLEQKLVEQFIVLYAGNLGLSQGWETILEAAAILQETEPDVLFVLVGDGTARVSLDEQVRQRNLSNIRFIPFQPFERVPEVLATADIAFLSLQSNVGAASIPSKLFSYLASGRPILAIVDTESDAAKLVRAAGAGRVVAAGNASAIAETLRELKANPGQLEAYCAQSRRYAESRHSPLVAARELENLFSRAIANHE